MQRVFGYSSFRPGQEKLIDGVLSGQDVFGIMPTGGGKSMCYQLPALMLPGITLVISPLISLMRDQVMALKGAGVPAAFLNSTLTGPQMQAAYRNLLAGRYKIVYVAPERLDYPGFGGVVEKLNISFIAVDEAHCISQWGQDFRPSYLRIVQFIDSLPKRPVVGAFTATATRSVQEDVERILELRSPVREVTGFDRPNLYFEVIQPESKDKTLLRLLAGQKRKSGIIYCATRKKVESVCELLCDHGYATRYHAGLSEAERSKNQEDFLYDRKTVMVATNAFGMGIDKSNVSFVIHYNMPKSIEAYYQEAGRAGRDGERADCILLYSPQDVRIGQFLLEEKELREDMTYEEAQAVRERDAQRLKQMTFYCFTHDCLREYILKYFGEYGKSYCGNCLNCQTEFEEQDVSQEARAMIRCVESSGQRYGVNVILDTLRGASTAKIRQYEMDGNPEYGVCAKIPAHRLRQIFNYLVLKEYLHLTDDGYTIVKLTAASRSLLEEAHILTMKMSKELETKKKEKRSRLPKSAVGELGEQDEPLFQKLRALRLEIAREEKIPPYMVFSDKTLIHMCILKPGNEEEMLNVTGVGRHKYEKYGKRFIDAVKNL